MDGFKGGLCHMFIFKICIFVLDEYDLKDDYAPKNDARDAVRFETHCLHPRRMICHCTCD